MKNDKKHDKVWIIIPALNEYLTIGEVISSIKKLKNFEFEIADIIVADGGSVDPTPEVAKELGASVIYVRKRGWMASIIEALQHINGSKEDIVVAISADGAYDASDIPKLVEVLSKDKYLGLVIGARNADLIPLHSKILSFLLKIKFSLDVDDITSTFLAFRKEALLTIKNSLKETECNLLVILLKLLENNFKVRQVRVKYRKMSIRRVSWIKCFKYCIKYATKILQARPLRGRSNG